MKVTSSFFIACKKYMPVQAVISCYLCAHLWHKCPALLRSPDNLPSMRLLRLYRNRTVPFDHYPLVHIIPLYPFLWRLYDILKYSGISDVPKLVVACKSKYFEVLSQVHWVCSFKTSFWFAGRRWFFKSQASSWVSLLSVFLSKNCCISTYWLELNKYYISEEKNKKCLVIQPMYLFCIRELHLLRQVALEN